MDCEKEQKETMETKILSILTDDWKPSYALVKVSTPKGWLGNSADRVARDMAEHGIIERKRDGKYAYYRLPQEIKQQSFFELCPA